MTAQTLLLAAIAILPCLAYGAGDGPLDRATLRGLASVSVVVDQIDSELERQGLTREALQTRIQSRLQNAGITVNDKALEFLGVRIDATRVRRGPFVAHFTAALYQPVLLFRDREIKTATQTWESATMRTAEPKLISQSAMNAVDQLVDRFVEAFRSVNPQ
jgi:hypothetical protein